jgi:deoxyribodipyrimidine photo-lyase
VSASTIVWFRDDLRITDHPALNWAIERGGPIVALYLFDQESPEIRPLGSASKWWLRHSLEKLDASLRALGGSLTLRSGPARTVIPELVTETSAGAVAWNRRYGPSKAIDQELKTALRSDGIEAESFHANVLFEPWTITTKDGRPFQVFTPFWRTCLSGEPPREPLPAPTTVTSLKGVTSEHLDEWALVPTSPDWSGGLAETWQPGEAGATARLEAFLDTGLALYHRRDEPGIDATSMLSPHLRFGEISPHQVWHHAHRVTNPDARKNVDKFLSEIGWREFTINVLFQHPDLHTHNIKPAFDHFPWQWPDQAELRPWQQGLTGIPLVDAGMRQLWHTGYMHNRVRMVTASFLVKNMLVHWRLGEQWFWDTLVDADEANNPGSWQWVAGCGTDAAPYFRVFNPVVQAEKFDPDGGYRKKWVPEWGTDDYPEPILDLKESRVRALSAFDVTKAAPPTG